MASNDWTQVRWTEARQVGEAMGLSEADRAPEGTPPRDWYDSAVARGDLEPATLFLGHALPRFEAVAWAARLLEEDSHRRKLDRRDQQALDRVLRWLDDPSDEYRRQAYVASGQASEGSAEGMLATAVYLSGGSIAPADLHPVNPEPHLSGRFAATAVVIAAHRSGDAPAAFREALDLGERIAAGDRSALAR